MTPFVRSGSVVSSDVSTVRAVELDCSAPVLTECIIGHVVLLGDSIFDNFRFVPGEPTVIDQLREELPPGWCASLLAVDGHVAADVPAQVANLPGDATHLVVSAGGNDALLAKQVVNQIALKMGKSPRYVQGLLREMVMKHWGEPSVDFKKAIEQVMERRRQAVEKKLAPASEEEGEDIIPMTASRRRASLTVDTPIDEIADAVIELLKEEFGPDLNNR